MIRDHFHIGGEKECFACNPGHAETGICTGCWPKLGDVGEWAYKVYPWDDSYDGATQAAHRKVTSPNGVTGTWTVQVWGGNKSNVQRKLRSEVDRLVEKLKVPKEAP